MMMVCIMALTVFMLCFVLMAVSMKIPHVMIVVFMCLVQYDIEITGIYS